MPLPVPLDEVVNELDIIGDETAVYVNRVTGEVVTVYEPDLGIVEEGGETEGNLEWGDDTLPVLRSIVETDDWCRLPDKFEIHEWEIMRRFADTRPSGLASELNNAIRGRGAFRMFKDAVYRHGVEDEWFAFKRHELRTIAAEALEEAGIPFRA